WPGIVTSASAIRAPESCAASHVAARAALDGACPVSSSTHRAPIFTAPAGAPGVLNDTKPRSTTRAESSAISCIGFVDVARYAARSESLTTNESGVAGGLNVAAITVIRLYGRPARRTSHWKG